jgi:hypothetical protein
VALLHRDLAMHQANARYEVCGCPGVVHAGVPTCTCDPPNFDKFVCGNPYPLEDLAEFGGGGGGVPSLYGSLVHDNGLQD